MNICDIKWLKRKTWPKLQKDNSKKPLKIVDLFSGCGGMSLGAWEAIRSNGRSFDLVLAVDSYEDAISVLRENFKQFSSTQDFRTCAIEELFSCRINQSKLLKTEVGLREKYGNIDLLLAGPPCQGNSDLNNNTRRNDPRNALYGYVARAVKILKPKVVIIENVPTVVHDKANVVESVKAQMAKLGYSTKEMLLDFSKMGIAQKRKRHLLVCSLKKSITDLIIPVKTTEIPLSRVLADLLDVGNLKESLFDKSSNLKKENIDRINYLFKYKLYDLPNEQRPNCHKNKAHSYMSMYGRLNWEKPSQTITTGFGSPGQGRYIHPLRKRLITPHEAARIQYFPDFYKFDSLLKRTSLQKVIGNAVPPKIMGIIVNELLVNEII